MYKILSQNANAIDFSDIHTSLLIPGFTPTNKKPLSPYQLVRVETGSNIEYISTLMVILQFRRFKPKSKPTDVLKNQKRLMDTFLKENSHLFEPNFSKDYSDESNYLEQLLADLINAKCIDDKVLEAFPLESIDTYTRVSSIYGDKLLIAFIVTALPAWTEDERHLFSRFLDRLPPSKKLSAQDPECEKIVYNLCKERISYHFKHPIFLATLFQTITGGKHIPAFLSNDLVSRFRSKKKLIPPQLEHYLPPCPTPATVADICVSRILDTAQFGCPTKSSYYSKMQLQFFELLESRQNFEAALTRLNQAFDCFFDDLDDIERCHLNLFSDLSTIVKTVHFLEGADGLRLPFYTPTSNMLTMAETDSLPSTILAKLELFLNKKYGSRFWIATSLLKKNDVLKAMAIQRKIIVEGKSSDGFIYHGAISHVAQVFMALISLEITEELALTKFFATLPEVMEMLFDSTHLTSKNGTVHSPQFMNAVMLACGSNFSKLFRAIYHRSIASAMMESGRSANDIARDAVTAGLVIFQNTGGIIFPDFQSLIPD